MYTSIIIIILGISVFCYFIFTLCFQKQMINFAVIVINNNYINVIFDIIGLLNIEYIINKTNTLFINW